MTKFVSKEYAIGFVEAKGVLGFSTSGPKSVKTPTFQLRVGAEDEPLLVVIRDSMGLKNRIYRYENKRSKGRGYCLLIVREIGSLKNIVIPLLLNGFVGEKAANIRQWLDKIGEDPAIPERYKILSRLYKKDYYKKPKN